MPRRVTNLFGQTARIPRLLRRSEQKRLRVGTSGAKSSTIALSDGITKPAASNPQRPCAARTPTKADWT